MIDKIKPEDRIEVRPVDVVDKVVDAASGTVGISIRIENPKLLTLAGVKCGLFVSTPSSLQSDETPAQLSFSGH